MRTSIVYFFHYDFEASSHENWDGREGTVSIICQVFKLKKTKRYLVRKVLEQCIHCVEKCETFSTNLPIGGNIGKPTVIEKGSYKDIIIADWMESVLDFWMTTTMVNAHWEE